MISRSGRRARANDRFCGPRSGGRSEHVALGNLHGTADLDVDQSATCPSQSARPAKTLTLSPGRRATHSSAPRTPTCPPRISGPPSKLLLAKGLDELTAQFERVWVEPLVMFSRSLLRAQVRPSHVVRSLRFNTTRAADDLPRVSGAAPQNSPPQPKRKAGFFRKTWRVTYISAIAATVWFTYTVYQNRHPGEQFEQDPNKKTLVILGSGWGSCALLKQINAEDYNVVIVSPRNYFLFTRESLQRADG